MKVKCADCGEMYDHIQGDYGPADVCGRCFESFDGMTAEELAKPDSIWELQREYQACPAVYGVWVQCAGEETLSDLYESQEAANLHRDYYNAHNRNGYLGKATVRTQRISTMAIAQKRFANDAK